VSFKSPQKKAKVIPNAIQTQVFDKIVKNSKQCQQVWQGMKTRK